MRIQSLNDYDSWSWNAHNMLPQIRPIVINIAVAFHWRLLTVEGGRRGITGYWRKISKLSPDARIGETCVVHADAEVFYRTGDDARSSFEPLRREA